MSAVSQQGELVQEISDTLVAYAPSASSDKTHEASYNGEIGGAGNTFLKLLSLPEIRARVIRIKEILESEG